ncbi:MAG: hypothetical protein OEV94_11360 [Deltaproteobacteria bacterium]|nr:hypothetical protein [Deltaproteobacteria bacterium]
MSEKIPSEERFEAMLDERFDPARRRDMVSGLLAHDRDRRPEPFPQAFVRGKILFFGAVPQAVRKAVTELVPPLLAHGEQLGLVLRDKNHQIHLYDKPSYEAATGSPVPPGVPLPAASYRYNPLYRVYTIQVVLPPLAVGEASAPPDVVLGMLRVLFARLLGDLWLREEVFSLESWREDAAAGKTGGPTAGFEEKVVVLSGVNFTPPPLAKAVETWAKRAGMNPTRLAAQARKGFFQDLLGQTARQMVPRESEAAVEETFRLYLAGLERTLPQALKDAVAAVEEADRQVMFLPAEEWFHYRRLAQGNPLAYMRAAQARMGFLLESLAAAAETFSELEGGKEIGKERGENGRAKGEEKEAEGVNPHVKDHLDSHLETLTQTGLARPFLLDNVRLSARLEARRKAFPLEVHQWLKALPQPDPQAHQLLTKRCRMAVYQRLYQVFLLLKEYLKAAEGGRGESFRQSPRHKELKAQVNNFRFRAPMINALHVRVGLLLDLAEQQASMAKSPRLPLDSLSRGWGQFISHRVLGLFFARNPNLLPGFDLQRYQDSAWAQTRAQAATAPHLALAALLHALYKELLADGGDTVMARLAAGMKANSGTFRHALLQALRPAEKDRALPAERRVEQLDALARAVAAAWRESRKNEIVVLSKT